MKKINNKGFTLVEVLAVIVIIAIIGMIAVPNVINSINTGKKASYDILVEDITIAGKQLFEEVTFVGSVPNYDDDIDGKPNGEVTIVNDSITVTLQTLVSNGFLTGINNPNKDGENKNAKIITNPKNNEDIGKCKITITKTVDNNYNTSYEIKNNSTSNNNCPTDTEYAKVIK